MVKSGKLDKRITFFKQLQTADGYGGSIPTRQDIRTTNANVKPLRQDRTVQANQIDLIGGYEIYIRYRVDFVPEKTMFIDYKGIILTPSSIQQSEEDRQMWFIIAMRKK